MVNSALSALRAQKAEAGGEPTASKSEGKKTDSTLQRRSDSGSKKKKKEDEDDKSSAELMFEAGAQGMKEQRLLRRKVKEGNEQSTKALVSKIANLIYDKFGQLSFSQIMLALMAIYFIIWPGLKPEIRRVLQQLYLSMAKTKEIFLSKVSSKLVGVATTAAAIALRPSPPASDEDDGDSPTLHLRT